MVDDIYLRWLMMSLCLLLSSSVLVYIYSLACPNDYNALPHLIIGYTYSLAFFGLVYSERWKTGNTAGISLFKTTKGDFFVTTYLLLGVYITGNAFFVNALAFMAQMTSQCKRQLKLWNIILAWVLTAPGVCLFLYCFVVCGFGAWESVRQEFYLRRAKSSRVSIRRFTFKRVALQHSEVKSLFNEYLQKESRYDDRGLGLFDAFVLARMMVPSDGIRFRNIPAAEDEEPFLCQECEQPFKANDLSLECPGCAFRVCVYHLSCLLIAAKQGWKCSGDCRTTPRQGIHSRLKIMMYPKSKRSRI